MGNVQPTEANQNPQTPESSANPCNNCNCETEEHAYNSKLYGTVKNYYRHIILCSGELDWVRKLEKDDSNIASTISKMIKQYEGGLSYVCAKSHFTN